MSILRTNRLVVQRQRMARLAAMALLLLLIPLMAACQSSVAEGGPQSVEGAINLVIDTDMAADDMMAILFLLNHPDVNIMAITVSGTGIAFCGPGTQHALGLLALAGREDIPVACGRDKPLSGTNAFPASWRQGNRNLAGLELPEPETGAQGSAVELLRTTVGNSPHKVTILTLGPLTNVAAALQRRPELVRNVEAIYTMGGAVDVGGNAASSAAAEWNVFIDPHAAQIVFELGVPLTLVPLDATTTTPVNRFFYAALEQHHTTPEAAAVYDLMSSDPNMLSGWTFFWDQLAAAILTDNSLATFETRRLSVVEEGENEGQTLESEAGTPVRVAVRADALRFEEHFLSTLNDGAAVTITRPEPDMIVTLDGDACSGELPESVPVGAFVIRMVNHREVDFGAGVITLVGDKTFADIDTWPSMDQPPWVSIVEFGVAPPGGDSLVEVHATDGPLYVVCFLPTAKLNTLGPIEVEP